MSENALLNQLSAEIMLAMKERAAERLSVLRMLKTALTNEKIFRKCDLTEADELTVISRLAKQRAESAVEYRKGQREELAQKEEAELRIVQEYLPAQLTEAEIKNIIESAIDESQVSSKADMGKVMKIIAPKIKGRADGKEISQRVQRKLSAS